MVLIGIILYGITQYKPSGLSHNSKGGSVLITKLTFHDVRYERELILISHQGIEEGVYNSVYNSNWNYVLFPYTGSILY